MIEAVDLYGGPGGWDVAARVLGLDPLGIEWDSAACATREAASLRTLQADVSTLDPLLYICELLIASPPCQAFSRAGKRLGLADLPLVYEIARKIAAGMSGWREEAEWADPRSELVLEPLRWAITIKPRWLAWEQVPDVLPFWEFCAELLRQHGWNVWTGILSTERYGVPQTRERAILMADREAAVSPPPPTHQRYIKPKKESEAPSLFDAPPEVDRIVLPEDEHLLPWVSMEEALGWNAEDELEYQRGAGQTERYGERPNRAGNEPAFTIRAGNTAGGCGNNLKRIIYDRRQNDGRTGEPVAERSAAEPAPTLTAAGLAKGRDQFRLRNGNQENASERDSKEPAPTIAFGHNAGCVEWVMEKSEDRADYPSRNTPRSADEPAATIDTRTDLAEWVGQRPATAICGDPRVFPPGGHIANDGRDNSQMVGRSEDAVRVSLEEAAALQSFPFSYPFQGTQTKRFEQVGNAVPPLFAHAILLELLSDG